MFKKIILGLFVGFISGMFASRWRSFTNSCIYTFIQFIRKRSKSHRNILYTTNGCYNSNILWKRQFYKLESGIKLCHWWNNRKSYRFKTIKQFKRKIFKTYFYNFSSVFWNQDNLFQLNQLLYFTYTFKLFLLYFLLYFSTIFSKGIPCQKY